MGTIATQIKHQVHFEHGLSLKAGQPVLPSALKDEEVLNTAVRQAHEKPNENSTVVFVKLVESMKTVCCV